MFWKLAGGARGVAMMVLLALAGILIPMKFGALFLDPGILLAYNGIAILLASNFVVRGTVGCEELDLARRIVAKGALYGWSCWALVLGIALGALAQRQGRLLLPPALLLMGIIALAGAAAWLAACLASMAALNVQTVKVAGDLMRLGFFFVLLLLVAGPHFLPVDAQRAMTRFLNGAQLGPALLLAAGLLWLAGLALLHHVRTLILDRATKLSITGE
jgi:hypothetical protein